jgi:hypothetical protein
VRIPARICSCLDWFGIKYNRSKALDVLSTFYLFIGVIDHVLDTISIDLGCRILDQLRSPYSFEMDCPESIITENLKTKIEPGIFPMFLLKVNILYAAVCREQGCLNVNDYIGLIPLFGAAVVDNVKDLTR